MQALRRASLTLRNGGFGIRASLWNSAQPNPTAQNKGIFANSSTQASANLFTVRRGHSSQVGANPWARENIPPIESLGTIKEGEQKAPQGIDSTRKLIKKFVNFRMRGGKRTGVRAMMYQTLRRVAQSERDVIKLVDEAVENVKPVCKVEKVGIAGAIYDVPGLVSRHRQESLAIRWILDAASRRRVTNKVPLEKCLFAELVDAHRKKGVARKKRESVHKLASANRSFAHFRWW